MCSVVIHFTCAYLFPIEKENLGQVCPKFTVHYTNVITNLVSSVQNAYVLNLSAGWVFEFNDRLKF